MIIMKNYYEILGVDRNDNINIIKKKLKEIYKMLKLIHNNLIK